MIGFCISAAMVVVVKADYHERVGIPLAARIKAYEDEIFGNPEMEARVSGSEPAIENSYPYMAGLIMRLNTGNVSICGSSLVTTTRLVTAAHCLAKAKGVKARFASLHIYYGGILRRTRDFLIHPDYPIGNKRFTKHDIGIVKFRKPVILSETIQLINLPSEPGDTEVIGEWAMTAGWGYTKDEERGKPGKEWELNDVAIQIADELLCEQHFHSERLHGYIICTDGAFGKGTCDGDSGGPLMVTRNDRKILIGVTLGGYSICEAEWPSLFTKTEIHKDFILS